MDGQSVSSSHGQISGIFDLVPGGVFFQVMESGEVKAGDFVTVIENHREN